MGFLISCNRVNNFVWHHHQDLSEVIGEKAIWELNMDVVCCSEHTIEAAPHKTATIRSLSSHLPKSSK